MGGAWDAYQVFKATGKTVQAQKEANLDMDRIAKLETENADLKKKLDDVLARLSNIEGQLKGGAAPAAAAEEEDAEAERIKAERIAAYNARKAAKEDKKGKVIAIGYGIKKLQITCVIEDDKVMMDDLEEKVV